VLYSSHFVEAVDTLYWFILGQAMMQIQAIATALMIGLDRLKAYATVMVAGAVVNTILAVALVPRLGLFGAGVAAFTSASVLAFGAFGYLRLRDSFRVGRSVGLGTLLLFIGLGLTGAFVGVRPSFEIGTLLVKLVVGAALFAFIVPVSLDRDERRALLSRLGTVFGHR